MTVDGRRELDGGVRPCIFPASLGLHDPGQVADIGRSAQFADSLRDPLLKDSDPGAVEKIQIGIE